MSYAHDALDAFDNMLGSLDHIASRAQDAGCGDDLLARAKLAEHMFPLELQFRIALNQVLLSFGQVWSLEVPLEEMPYASFAVVRERIGAVRDRIASARKRKAVDADTVIDLTLPNGVRFVMTAREYLRDWMLPNFYFHATTAYGVLRHEGLELGKLDFMTHMSRYIRSAGD